MSGRLRRAMTATACLALLVPFVPAEAIDRSGCTTADTSAQTIAACSTLLTTDRRAPDRAADHFIRALSYLHLGFFDAAIRDLDAAVRETPQFSDAYLNRGLAWFGKGRSERAIADYTTAIAQRPSSVTAYLFRGVAEIVNGPEARAIADLSAVADHYPDGDAAFYRGIAHFEERDDARAASDFQLALADFPTYATYETGAKEFGRPGLLDVATMHVDRAPGANPYVPYAVLLLHVARARSGVDDSAEFQKHVSALDRAHWPEDLTEIFLTDNATGMTGSEPIATDPDGRGRSCETVFFLGEYDAIHHDATRAATNFDRAAAVCPHRYLAYWLARSELRR